MQGKKRRTVPVGMGLGMVVALDDGDFEGETFEMFVN
jgi:hypothetical protein